MLKHIFSNPYRNVVSAKDLIKVKNTKRFKEGVTGIYGEPVWYSDSFGFLHSVKEIFIDEVYRFKAKSATPRIIDAGANIGLSVLYFKRLYPQAHIVAFEPDGAIFKILERNIAARNMTGVELKNAAVWTEDGVLNFYSEGSLAGSTEVDFNQAENRQTVRAERLLSYLTDNRVDFLKMDIEGAENSVLFNIQPALHHVDQLFIEYHSIAGQAQMLGEMLVAVKSAGFKYYLKNATSENRHPFMERKASGFDLQLNIFCFRD
jgi:FkbM family methyltransferase